MYEINKNKQISLEELITHKQIKFEKLEKELEILKSITVPLDVQVIDDAYNLYSKDYSLATQVKIKKRSEIKSSNSDYDGGDYTALYEFYPQFYFTIEKKIILIQHEGFETDDNIIIKKKIETKGYGDRKHMTNCENLRIDKRKIYAYLRELRVPELLLDKLKNEIKIIETYEV